MQLEQLNLFHQDIGDIIKALQSVFHECVYDHKKHVINLSNEQFDEVGYLRLPLSIKMNETLQPEDEEQCVLYLTIEAGKAAIVIMEGEENVYHTTFSAYMTRKKQGFSQVKYLKKKGKSRAGSRVRLAETDEFFDGISQTIEELMEEYYIDRIAIDCAKTLLPHFFQSKYPCPIEKTDDRIYKIPLHIPQSNFTNLGQAIRSLKAPVLCYHSVCKEFIDNLKVMLEVDSEPEDDDFY